MSERIERGAGTLTERGATMSYPDRGATTTDDENRRAAGGRRRSPAARLAARVAGLFLLLLAAGACDELLEVEENPNTVPGDEVDRESSFDARFVGAEADFWFSYDMSVVWGGLFADELVDGTGFDEVDQRRVTADNGTIGAVDEAPEGLDGLWTPMQKAFFSANLLAEDIAAGTFPDQVPDGTESAEFARMSFFRAYARMNLAERFCTVAFEGTGPELTSAEAWQLAEEEFTAAIDAANASDEIRNAALVGRSRVRMLLGDRQGAVADAEQVPLEFEFVGDVYSGNSQKEENDIWNMLTDSQRFSVAPLFRDLVVDDTQVEDPRVPVFQDPNDRFAIDGTTPLYQTEKCDVNTCSLRLASGFEAKYNIAEVMGGQRAVDIINQIRDAQGIEEEFSSSDPDEIFAMVLDERRRTLFIEGQRMGDLRRLAEQNDPATLPEIGRFPEDDEGDQICMPLPNAERDNNPDL